MDGFENDTNYLKGKRKTDECSSNLTNKSKISKSQSSINKSAIKALLMMATSLFDILKNNLQLRDSKKVNDIEECKSGIIDLINCIYSSNLDKDVSVVKEVEKLPPLDKISSTLSKKIEETVINIFKQKPLMNTYNSLETPSPSFASTVSNQKSKLNQ